MVTKRYVQFYEIIAIRLLLLEFLKIYIYICNAFQVQISCTEVLTLLCSHLIDIVRESSKSLACYLADLFSRLKLFKVLLHCVLSSVYHPKYNNGHLSYQVLRFNEGFGGSRDRLPRHSETLQKQLIRLLLNCICRNFVFIFCFF